MRYSTEQFITVKEHKPNIFFIFPRNSKWHIFLYNINVAQVYSRQDLAVHNYNKISSKSSFLAPLQKLTLTILCQG